MDIGEVIEMWCGTVDLRDIDVKSVRRLTTDVGERYILLEFNNYAEANIFTTGFTYHHAGGASVSLQGKLGGVDYARCRIGYTVTIFYDSFVVHLNVSNKHITMYLAKVVERLANL